MTVGIVGLGLIGGSLAKAYRRDGSHEILVFDIDKAVSEFAILSGVAVAALCGDNMGRCDVLFLATYPAAAAEFLRARASEIAAKTLVIDCLGTKREICELGFRLAAEHGFTFAGGHPMAGSQNSGYKHSSEDLFDGAPMVIVPPKYDDIELLDRIKTALAPARFGSVAVTTAEEHDEIIAFTSQLAHVVSNAYVKSPSAPKHKGFSAGSYRDLTRVAALSPDMWTQLFLENSDKLLGELEGMISELSKYRDAVSARDAKVLENLLREGSDRKREIDKA